MKRIWVARMFPKDRNILRKGQYHQIKADSPEKLLRKLLETKHKAWYEIYRVEIIRKIHAKEDGLMMFVEDV